MQERKTQHKAQRLSMVEAALWQALGWAVFAVVCHLAAAARLLWVVGG